MSKLVRASGCVVWRPSPLAGGDVEVLVVHRPRYDDWSFPKGKLDEGETDLECALREVKEETGLSGEIGVELEPVCYVDNKGRDKIVRYWVMRVGDGAFEANDEVDEVCWLAPAMAAERLTYSHDANLLEQFLVAIDD